MLANNLECIIIPIMDEPSTNVTQAENNFGNETPDVVTFLKYAQLLHEKMDARDTSGTLTIITPAKIAASRIVDSAKRMDALNALNELERGLRTLQTENQKQYSL